MSESTTRYVRPRRGRRAGSVDVARQAIIARATAEAVDAVVDSGIGQANVDAIVSRMIEDRAAQGKSWTVDTARTYLTDALRAFTAEDGATYRAAITDTAETVNEDGTVTRRMLDRPEMVVFEDTPPKVEVEDHEVPLHEIGEIEDTDDEIEAMLAEIDDELAQN